METMMRTTTWAGGFLVLLILAAMLLAAGAAAATQPPAQGAPAQDEFVPVKDLPQQEQLPGGPLVLAAYGFVWAVLLVYLWTIWRRLGTVEREMRDLAARIAGRDQGA
jgi:CcmD family protein